MGCEGTVDPMVARELDSCSVMVDGVDWVLTVLWERVDGRDRTYAIWRRKNEIEPEMAHEIPLDQVMYVLNHPTLTFYHDHEPAHS